MEMLIVLKNQRVNEGRFNFFVLNSSDIISDQGSLKKRHCSITIERVGAWVHSPSA